MNTVKSLRPLTRQGILLLLAPVFLGCSDNYETVTVPAGTQVTVRLEEPLSTRTNETGDVFRASTVEPLTVDGRTVVPEGTEFRGELTELENPGRVEGRARMTLAFRTAKGPEGVFHDIPAQLITIEAQPETGDDLEKVSAGAIAGAIIGGLAKGGKGAAIGAAVGAGAGGLVVVSTRGEDLTLEEGQAIRVTLAEPVEIPVARAQQNSVDRDREPSGEEG